MVCINLTLKYDYQIIRVGIYPTYLGKIGEDKKPSFIS